MASNDNSGMGVILGILVAVVLGFGAFYLMSNQDGPDVEMPDVNVSAPAAE